MKEIIYDCLKSDEWVYDSLYGHQRGEIKNHHLKVPTFRDADELFAFKWPELPEDVQDCVSTEISKKFGTDDEATIKRIFKCKVARDVDLILPYLKAVEDDGSSSLLKIYKRVFNEETFTWEDQYVDAKSSKKSNSTKYKLMMYVGLKSTRSHDTEGYGVMKCHGMFAGFRFDPPLYNYEDGADECVRIAKEIVSEYFGDERQKYAKNEMINNAYAKLQNLDWTKKNTFHLKKADFMKCPRKWDDKYPHWHDTDHVLLDTIKKYNLTSDVEQEFIDWIASGCKVKKLGGKTTKLSHETACLVKNKVDYGWLGRGNVVEFYHGFDDDDLFDELEVGSVFTSNNTRYVVIDVFFDDGVTKVIGYAREGTAIDCRGMMDSSKILLGCREGLIEDCWDALFDVNRVGKRKKILKNVKIIKE